MPLWSWSRTSAAANGSADPGINFLENQAPSSLNDSARALMQATAQYRDDTAGGTVTTGSASAYALSTFSNFTSASALANQMVAFTAHVTNGAIVTMTVDSVPNIPLRSSPGKELPAGVLIQGTNYCAVFNPVDSVLYLQGFYGNPFNVPLGAGMDYWGTTAPNSSFAFPIGQQISQTTYASLYALFGSNRYGPDGGGLFYLPDKTGRVSAMQESVATRLPSAYFVGNSTALGAVGGSADRILSTANLPAYTPSGSVAVTNGAITLTPSGIISNAGGGLIAGGGSLGQSTQISASQAASSASFSGNAQGGTSTPIATIQPTIIANYVIRVL